MTARPPEVVTCRLGLLSRIRHADADAVAVAVRESLEHLRPWMPWAKDDDPAARREFCRLGEKQWTQGTDFIFVLRQATGEPALGTFGLHRRIGPGAIELGYWVCAAHTGRGLATSAAGALTEVALQLADTDRVEIHTDEANTVSAAIPRRLGYRLDRIESVPREAPAESGRRQIWVRS